MYLANNDPHVAGASRYGQHLQRVVTSQYLYFVAVTVYEPLISFLSDFMCTDHFPQLDCQFE